MPSEFRKRHHLIRHGVLAVAAALVVLWVSVIGPARAAGSAPVAPQLHTFTNDSGSSFKAEITGVSGDAVTLKRDDGQVFNPKISIFNKADQDYIRFWAAKNAKAHGNDVFQIQALSLNGVATPSVDQAKHVNLSSWQGYYRLDVKNLSFINWAALHFRYIIFEQSANLGELPPNDFTEKRVMGTFDLDKLASNGATSFETDKLDMQSETLFANTFFSSGAPVSTSDKLTGIWVRVYDDEDNLLQEWVSDPAILKTERWAFPTQTGMRGVPPGMANPYGTGRGARGEPSKPTP